MDSVKLANYYKKVADLLLAFQKHMEIVNGDYIAKHLTGYIFHEWITYRNPDNDWFAKDYRPDLDEEAKALLCNPKDKGFYVYVIGTDRVDGYVTSLIDGFEENHENESYNEIKDNESLKESISKWKKEIVKGFDRKAQIRGFVRSIGLWGEDGEIVRRTVESMANSILSPNDPIDYSEFQYKGMCFQIIDYLKREVRLKSINGLFGEYSRYGKINPVLPNEASVSIPSRTDASASAYSIVEIGKGVFDSLTETECIYLGDSVRKIEWSFWNCRKLKAISINNDFYQSIGGVLYSKDKKVLYAYPNNHGKSYAVIDGTEEINRFAFKDCEMLEELFLPGSIKRIGINAFYRCVNLKVIVSKVPKEEIQFEGYVGDYGNVSPNWVIIPNDY